MYVPATEVRRVYSCALLIVNIIRLIVSCCGQRGMRTWLDLKGRQLAANPGGETSVRTVFAARRKDERDTVLVLCTHHSLMLSSTAISV